MIRDISDKRFGKLVAVCKVGKDKHGNSLWKCNCQCGTVKIIPTTRLLLGRSRSCGCEQVRASRRTLRRGSRFGRLKVLSFCGISNNRSMYLCECRCGNLTTVQMHRLKQGITKSCGCYQAEVQKSVNLTHGLTNTPEYRRAVVNRRRARKIKAGGSHSAEDIVLLRRIQKNRCTYCKRQLGDYHVDHMIPLARGGSNGLENICLACPDCNRKKNTKTAEEFKRVLANSE
jgi:5-methylcytosine-specific restriction endonuclease McrA